MANRNIVRFFSGLMAQDQPQTPIIRRDISAGMNTRQHPTHIGETQCELLENINIDTLGKRRKRRGSVQVSDNVGDEVVALFDYRRQGYKDQLLIAEANDLNASEDEGNHAEIKGDFTASQTDIGFILLKESGLVPDDVVFVNFGGAANWWRAHKDSTATWATQDLGNTAGTGSDSPPRSTVGAWFGNRVWILKNDQLYFSAAYSDDYASAFDTVSDVYRVPVGEERGIHPTRDTGIVIMGKEAIWGIAPSAVPVATDKPEPLITTHGVVSKKGWCAVGDDLYFFSQDGLRSLSRTVQDKLQMQASEPISFPLKVEFEEIAWAYIERLSMIYEPIRNIIKINVPISATAFKTWVYYPNLRAWTVETGKNVLCYTTHKIDGEVRLYYGSDQKVFRDDYGYSDEGTTATDGTFITATEEGREEDSGNPLVKKCGGEIEVEAVAIGSDHKLTVSVKADGGNYVELGDIELESDSAPTLPIELPFTLSDSYVIRKKFPLDALQEYRTIQYKIDDSKNTAVVSEEVSWQGVNIVTFQEEYQSV